MQDAQPSSRRSAAIAFGARCAALVVLGTSSAIAIVEDPKDVAKQNADLGKACTPPAPRAGVEASMLEDAPTFVDPRTSLVWQTKAGPQHLDWESSGQYCAALSLDGGGWRLPTREELQQLFDRYAEPLRCEHDWYWTSSPGVRQGTAWAGGVGGWLSANRYETKSRARCVRAAHGTSGAAE